LQHASSPPPPLLALFPHWLHMAQHHRELLEALMPLLESYVLLGGAQFMVSWLQINN
jgi:hypothetical protein